MITITPAAAQQILLNAQTNGGDGLELRIAAKRLPNNSIQYGMGFDDEREGDAKFDSEGIVFLVSSSSAKLLEGATLDFVELSPGTFQFIFINPHDADEPSMGGFGSAGANGGE